MKTAIDEKEVAAYLKSHPEFFEHYADLLAQVLIPDPHGGHAISITERQLGTLRERNKKLEAKLTQLLHFGEENDAIGDKVQRFAVALTAAADFAAVLRALYAHLGTDFAVPHVTLRLWGVEPPQGGEYLAEFAAPDAATLAFATGLPRPHCGPTDRLEALPWIGASVRSLALMPLSRGTEAIGFIALGSEEVHRFYPEMGSLFLTRIGDLASAALLRTL